MIDEPVLERREEMEADENEQRVSEQLVRFLGQVLTTFSNRLGGGLGPPSRRLPRLRWTRSTTTRSAVVPCRICETPP